MRRSSRATRLGAAPIPSLPEHERQLYRACSAFRWSEDADGSVAGGRHALLAFGFPVQRDGQCAGWWTGGSERFRASVCAAGGRGEDPDTLRESCNDDSVLWSAYWLSGSGIHGSNWIRDISTPQPIHRAGILQHGPQSDEGL